VVPRDGLDGHVIFRPPLTFDPWTVKSVASRYTDRGIAAHLFNIVRCLIFKFLCVCGSLTTSLVNSCIWNVQGNCIVSHFASHAYEFWISGKNCSGSLCNWYTSSGGDRREICGRSWWSCSTVQIQLLIVLFTRDSQGK
jgi:hypothetical protein